MNRIYILSHTDLDGYLSAGLVEFYYKRFIDNTASFKHKSWTYGRDLPSLNYIKDNFDKVFVVDLCPDESFMFNLYEHYKNNLIWIDHHVKSDTEFISHFNQAYPNNEVEGLRAKEDHSKSAALLTYDYFESKYNRSAASYMNYPCWLKYCSDFDCWNKTDENYWNNNVMPMFCYIKNKVTNPSQAYDYIQERLNLATFYDMRVDENDVHNIMSSNIQTTLELEEGVICYKTILGIYKTEAEHGFKRDITVNMNGSISHLNAWICNTQNRSSVIFEQMKNKDEYDVFIPYHYNGQKYFYSIYTFKSDIHCNEISIISEDTNEPVLIFNGHRDAAGANSEEFIFSK